MKKKLIILVMAVVASLLKVAPAYSQSSRPAKSGFTGSLTAGYVPFAVNSSVLSNSSIFVNSGTGNIGIGITIPTAKLHVNGTFSVTGNADIFNTKFTNGSINLTGDGRTYPGEIYAASVWASSLASSQLLFHSSGFSRIYETGSYGINIVTGGGDYLTIEAGLLKIPLIPTSSAGLPSGAVWSDGGTLKIVP
jgi:hypothetical protein